MPVSVKYSGWRLNSQFSSCLCEHLLPSIRRAPRPSFPALKLSPTEGVAGSARQVHANRLAGIRRTISRSPALSAKHLRPATA